MCQCCKSGKPYNGKVIAPGDVFSFNDTVGHRTIENGFSTAKEYVDGKSVDGIGGGTCQVSSTLYSAVLYADLSIVERLNHMMTVGIFRSVRTQPFRTAELISNLKTTPTIRLKFRLTQAVRQSL